jgi:PEP-CTERM motif
MRFVICLGRIAPKNLSGSSRGTTAARLARRSGVAFVLLCAAALGQVSTAQAAVISTFANFAQKDNSQSFIFTNLGASSTFGTTASMPVNFTFTQANSYGAVNQNIAAHLTLSSVVSNFDDIPGDIFLQPLRQIFATITADTAVAGKTLLLQTLVGTTDSTGVLFGQSGSNGGGLVADTAVGNDFSFKSDFLNFAATTSRNYSFALSSLEPALSGNDNNYLNNFTAFGSGSFAADIAVPEPSTLVMLGLGGIGLVAVRRRSLFQRN